MANCVLVPTKLTAMDVDSYTRSAVATEDIPNGTPLVCGVVSTNPGQKNVFSVTKAAAATKNIWMAYSPEVNVTQTGGYDFKGITVDPRVFTNIKDKPFDMFYPNPGKDLIQVTADFFGADGSPADVENATYVEIQADGTFKAVANATVDFANTQFRIVDEAPIIIGNGAIAGEAVQAWILECTIN